MDPDATLREMRELSSKMQKEYQDEDSNGIDQENADRLAELFQALDEWISRGGTKPYAWSRFD